MILYKRNAQGKPVMWRAGQDGDQIIIEHGLVSGKLHREVIQVTMKKTNELESRIKAKRKEGYKELSELKDSNNIPDGFLNRHQLIYYLDTYLPKYSTTEEGFVLPMLAKVLEDNKPFDKFGNMLGQWKINGLRCLVGARKDDGLFQDVRLTYHSRTGEDWTTKMNFMDDVILPNINQELLDMMIEEGAYLDGELYLPGYQVNDINSFVKNIGFGQHYLLQYWCYDVCCENMSADARYRLLRENVNIHYFDFYSKHEHLNNTHQFVLLPTFRDIWSINDAQQYRDDFINLGFEGLILRNKDAEYQFGKRNQAMFKFKKVDDGIFTIIDIIPEHKRANLPIFVLRNDINEELFECSANFTRIAQEIILANKENYIGKKVLVEYRERSGVNQLPFHARIVKLV